MTKFEYVTFTLGEYPTTASKYKKINDDLEEASKPMIGKDKFLVSMLTTIKAEFEKNYPATELSFTNENDEIKYWIQKLAKFASVELLSTGKVNSNTMLKMSCLTPKDFIECLKAATIMTSQLNAVVQKAEKQIQDTDVVPLEYM